MELCYLCKRNEAGSKKSHLVPKFVTKVLFDAIERHAILLKGKVPQRKVQDTFKVGNLLCDDCEARLSIIETFASRKISDIHKWQEAPTCFAYHNDGVNQWLKCISFNPSYLNLFFYSIIWRVSAASEIVDAFYGFKLGETCQEHIRAVLDATLAGSQKELDKNILSTESFQYPFCVFKPKKRLYPPRSTLSAQSKNGIHIISLSEFLVTFYEFEKDIPFQLKPFVNRTGNFTIILAENSGWDLLNTSFTKIEFID